MQLTNISRDVIEDSNNNRSYINKNFDDIKSTLNSLKNFMKIHFIQSKKFQLAFAFLYWLQEEFIERLDIKF